MSSIAERMMNRKRKRSTSPIEDFDTDSTLDPADAFTREELLEIKGKAGEHPHLELAKVSGYFSGDAEKDKKLSTKKASLIKFLVGKRRISSEDAIEKNLEEKKNKEKLKRAPRDQSNQVNLPKRIQAAGFVKTKQTDVAEVKQSKWFREFEDAIINNPTEIQVDEQTIQVPDWSRISPLFLNQGFKRDFDALPVQRKQMFMYYCGRVYHYLTVTMNWTADDIHGGERCKWNILTWMTAVFTFVKSEQDEECMNWKGLWIR